VFVHWVNEVVSQQIGDQQNSSNDKPVERNIIDFLAVY
jgi:hypothetical protein